MMDQPRTAAYLGLSVVLFLLVLGGWGAFAYNFVSGQQRESALRDALAQQERLTAELGQVRAELARSRQALERAQADLVVARAELEQLKTRPSQSPAAAPAPAANPTSGSRPRQGR
jgi:hypothetical protein